jgi:hypothetical protein
MCIVARGVDGWFFVMPWSVRQEIAARFEERDVWRGPALANICLLLDWASGIDERSSAGSGGS